MKKFLKIIDMIILSAMTVMLFAACSEESSNSGNSGSTSNSLSEGSSSNNNWPNKITIVLMPDEGNPDAGEKNEAFGKAMSEYLGGIKVEQLESFEYAVGIEAMKAGKLDILLCSPMSYYQAKRMVNIEPLVTTTTAGNAPYKTVFITKNDRDDINSLEDLRGKTFAFVDPASSSGYMYPKAKLLTELELEADKLENPGYFFSTVIYSGKHDSSIMGLIMGDFDAAAVAQQTIAPMVEAGLFRASDIIPSACYIMRADLPEDLKAKIKEFYLQYDDDNYFEQFYSNPKTRFIEAKDSDYDVVYEMVTLLKH